MLDFLEWLFISIVIALTGWGFIHVINDIWDIISEKKVEKKQIKENKSNLVKISKVELSNNIVYKLPRSIYVEEKDINKLTANELQYIVILKLLGCEKEDE